MDQTPEFNSYKRSYSNRWGEIMKILKMMEKMLTVGKVPYAIIDGKKVAYLAFDEFKKITLNDLLDCIVNQEEVEKFIRVPSRIFKGKPDLVATYIKKTYKMYKARTEYKKILFLRKCVKVIWSYYLRFKNKKKIKVDAQKKFKENLVKLFRKNGKNCKRNFLIIGQK